jgi:hypothetical protein
MKGATMALGSMNKSMNLPQLQRIAMEFERENDIMEQRQEMMDDAVDDAMDVGVEEEGDEVVEQVLEEIGIDLSQAVRTFLEPISTFSSPADLFDFSSSSATRPQHSGILYRQRARLLKPLVVEVVEAVAIQWTTICRQGWTASGNRRVLLRSLTTQFDAETGHFCHD